MYFKILFTASAFRHGIREDNIRRAFLHYCYDGPVENMENKFIRLGFDRSGNLLEIMYNENNWFTAKIFHAMKCRTIYYHLLEG